MPKKWNRNEDRIVYEHYKMGVKSKILEFLPNRTWKSIIHRAQVLQIRRCNRGNSNINKLLSDTPETYYWIGFLMADGHINNKQTISISLAKKIEII